MLEGVAFFDFDGTMIKGDSIVPFLWYGYKKKFVPVKQLFSAAWAFTLYFLKRLSAAEAKERGLLFLQGKTKEEMAAHAEAFYAEVLKKRLFKDALDSLSACRQKGLKVIIVSASPDVYMQAVKEQLGVFAVIATRCALDANDIYLGCLASDNCKGFEKPLRIAEYMASAGLNVDFESSAGFGDSFSDVPMLELTGQPTIVNGKKRTISKTPHMAHVKWK